MHRRHLLAAGLLAPFAACWRTAQADDSTARAQPGYRITFPRDAGSHPAFRTEWWYLTGWLDNSSTPVGFQITFFRTRLQTAGNPSRFAPQQIIIAHAAVSDPRVGRLLHDQRVGRAGFDLAGAAEGGLRTWIGDWRLEQHGEVLEASIPAQDFRLDFEFTTTQPPLLQGANGYSRKGAARDAASHYYSLPHLALSGTLQRSREALPVRGRAWLDHEWSGSYMATGAVGWDWLGINLDDGGALMVFRMRDANGAALWASATYRDARGNVTTLEPRDISFVARRRWRSPHTGTEYPVAWDVAAGALRFAVEPLMDDQESDTRLSTGTIYWEGAVRVKGERISGRGYLELTGYWRPLKL